MRFREIAGEGDPGPGEKGSVQALTRTTIGQLGRGNSRRGRGGEPVYNAATANRTGLMEGPGYEDAAQHTFTPSDAR